MANVESIKSMRGILLHEINALIDLTLIGVFKNSSSVDEKYYIMQTQQCLIHKTDLFLAFLGHTAAIPNQLRNLFTVINYYTYHYVQDNSITTNEMVLQYNADIGSEFIKSSCEVNVETMLDGVNNDRAVVTFFKGEVLTYMYLVSHINMFKVAFMDATNKLMKVLSIKYGNV